MIELFIGLLCVVAFYYAFGLDEMIRKYKNPPAEYPDEKAQFGKIATVISGFDFSDSRQERTGKVEFEGSTWTARMNNETDVIEVGDPVSISARDGLTLIVNKLK